MSLQVITQNSIATIEQLDAQGVELNLFIGRSPAEEGRSPDEKELPFPQNGSNERWCSLSIDKLESLLPQWNEDWIHLHRNCNNDDEIKRLQGKFKLVAIDLLTTKFFDLGTLERIASLIKKGGTLILPSQFQHYKKHEGLPAYKTNHFQLSVSNKKSDTLNQKRQKCWDDHLDDLVGKEKRLISGLIPTSKKFDIQLHMAHGTEAYKSWACSLKQMPKWWKPKDAAIQYLYDYSKNEHEIPSQASYDDERRMAREETKERLLELFENTVLYHQKYPYENRYDQFGEIPTIYYHATGKKE